MMSRSGSATGMFPREAAHGTSWFRPHAAGCRTSPKAARPAEAHKRGSGQSRGTPARLRGLPATARPAPLARPRSAPPWWPGVAQRSTRWPPGCGMSGKRRCDAGAPIGKKHPSANCETPRTTLAPVPRYPEIAANAALTLITVTCAILDRQLASLARTFMKEGGFTERLYRVRTAQRKMKE